MIKSFDGGEFDAYVFACRRFGPGIVVQEILV
jgi:hypothetical protein